MSKHIVASSQNIVIAPVLQRSTLSCREDGRWARDQRRVKASSATPQPLHSCWEPCCCPATSSASSRPSQASSEFWGAVFSFRAPPPPGTYAHAPRGTPSTTLTGMERHTHSLVCCEDGSSSLPFLIRFLIPSGSQTTACRPAASTSSGALLEMNIFRSPSRPAESENSVGWDPAILSLNKPSRGF